MKTKVSLFLVLSLMVVFSACDDVIHPTLESAEPIYVVDAFINNKLDTQVIHLMRTQPYFEEVLPPGVSGAVVTITDNTGNEFSFAEHPIQHGTYYWIPPMIGFGHEGGDYTLSIAVNGENFTSHSHMGRVPPVDSITFEVEDGPAAGGSKHYRGQFWAVDPKGTGDTYWIRTSKNGVFLNKPSEINIAYDASFDKGTFYDGFTFIQPIRNGINANDRDENDRQLSPFTPGDLVYVEIYSLTDNSFEFLSQVSIQTNRPGGFSELYARPLANVITNIANSNPKGSKVQGCFNVGAISGLGKVFTKVN